MIANISASGRSLMKGRFPVAISNSIAPSAYTSVRTSSASPNNCSGAMYGSEPTMVPDWVMRPVALPPARSTARPKSRIFGLPVVGEHARCRA